MVRAGAATRKHEPKRDALLTLPGGGWSPPAELSRDGKVLTAYLG